MRPGYGIDDDVLGHLLSAGFYHGNAALDAGHHQVKVGLLTLLWAEEGFKFTIHPANAQARHRPIKRRTRQHQGAAGSNHRHHIGAEARVHTKHCGHHLHFLAVAFGKEWADRPVDQAANQHCFVARPALTLNKTAAANLARGIELLFVVDAKREVIQRHRAAAHLGGAQHHRIAIANQHTGRRAKANAVDLQGEGAAA